MKVVNAAALLCLLIFVLGDLAHVLPRFGTLQTRDVVIHMVFDLGALVLLAFSIWCMFLRGPLQPASEFKMLVSLLGQVVMLAAVSFFALEPWAAMSTRSPSPDATAGVLTSFGILLVPMGIMAALMRWSTRIELVAAPAPVFRERRKKVPRAEDDEENQYYEPIPELMGDRYHEPTKVVVKEESGKADPSTAVIAAIPMARQCTCALLRVSMSTPKPSGAKKAKPKAPKPEAAVVGSATCIVADRYLVTAHQVLNGGQPRQPEDKFYALVCSAGGGLFHFPVLSFPVENPDLDLAVLEIGPCANGVEHLAPMPLAAYEIPDGSPVLTLGFPSPPITELKVDEDGDYLSARMLLRGHANTGIVAAQGEDAHGNPQFEFNVEWHHGEIGGPVIRLEPAPALFCVMTDYRPLQGPRGGVMVGPYQGRSLKPIENRLRDLGASFI